ncbi:MAG: SDR family oxidoreductase [Rhodospirillaceae bacterium]|nr:SDR family oxidoreductase [Rhodospirillaceae bacterium]
MSYLNDLAGKKVLVTGASTGIGAAVAKGLAECGARVAVHYNTSRAAADKVVEQIAAAGGIAFSIGADVTDSQAVASLVDESIDALDGLDILINNAGGLVRRAPTEEIDDHLFGEVIDLNSRSVVMACKAALPHFMAQKHGNIITTGSVAAHHGGGPGAGIYASSKAFLHTFNRALAKDYAAHGIRANIVAPGVVLTPFHADTPASAKEAWVKSIPLGRAAEPEDMVGAYLFLASDRMSSYVTGQVIDVNGGIFLSN